MNLAEHVAFVLQKPRYPGNIGSAARALKNMGFSDLRIVAPTVSLKHRDALAMAVHARDLLLSARIFPDLTSALEDCTLTVGTTCRPGAYRERAQPLGSAARDIASLAVENRVAIVFGPEDRGLVNRELKLCHRLLTIETAPAYPSLNLAQAIMVVAYQIMLSGAEKALGGSRAPEFARASAVDAAMERMADALVAIGFLPADNPDHIMFTVRTIFGRGGVTGREVNILNGIARQIRWVAEGGAQTLARKRATGSKIR